MLLEQNLRAAEREHAGQRPSGDRQNTIRGAGRKDERVKLDRIRDAGSDGVNELAVNHPHKR